MRLADRAPGVEGIVEAKQAWEQTALFPFMQRRPERRETFGTISGTPVERLYTPA
ncbi:MAG: hypothetical protein JO101_11955, partial [Candidatus Eremiobacteraeota bacterium]|nr:hypothetical protein [Candidatus Eremiobacteraeota bacterium]